MINKDCFLTNKGKLYTILHGECKYTHLGSSFICDNCPYFNSSKLGLVSELKEDLKLYNVDVEKEFKAILSSEIKTQQDDGFIKRGNI